MVNKYIIYLLYVCFFAGDYCAHANQLIDPGFEMEPQYSAWICWDDVNVSNWAKRDGSQGIFLRDWNDYGDQPPHSGGFYQDVKVEPGQKYVFAIWARKEERFTSEKLVMSVEYFNVKYHVLESRKTELEKAVTPEWKRYGLTTKSPPGAVYARVKIEFSGGENSKGEKLSCLFDDAVFEEKQRE